MADLILSDVVMKCLCLSVKYLNSQLIGERIQFTCICDPHSHL